MSKYDEFIARKLVQYGDKFDESALSAQFAPYFNTGDRIEVDFGYEMKRGRVSVTTGWRPCFLLVLTRRSLGSPWTLSDNDKILQTVSK